MGSMRENPVRGSLIPILQAAARKRRPHDWHAADYEIARPEILRQAAEDFSSRFQTFVLPRLLDAARPRS